MGCSPWGCEESDTTERLPFHFSLSCIGEGNGTPLQCSCLENPRDGGAWWAAVYGVAQSWTRLKRLSSSSSSMDRAGNYTQYAVIHHSGKESKKECIYVYNLVTLLYSRDWHSTVNQLYFNFLKVTGIFKINAKY